MTTHKQETEPVGEDGKILPTPEPEAEAFLEAELALPDEAVAETAAPAKVLPAAKRNNVPRVVTPPAPRPVSSERTAAYRSTEKKRFTEEHNLPGYVLVYLIGCGFVANIAVIGWTVVGLIYGF